MMPFILWMEIFAGEKATQVYGENEFSSGFYEYIKSVKGMPFFSAMAK